LSLDADIVIVGGGAAGVGAARHLARSGRTTLLLEATSRLGGRAWTQEMRGLPLDLGCGWLHSADRNAWTGIAASAGLAIDRNPPAWGKQFSDLGFTPAEQSAARQAFDSWMGRLVKSPPATDCAADALEANNEWHGYIRAIAGFISGAPLEKLSIADYVAYDENSSESNWRVRSGFGSLIARNLPEAVRVRLSTPVESIATNAEGVTVGTPSGDIRARAAILTVSTNVLAGDSIKLPPGLDPWREAAGHLPLGRNEKLFLSMESSGPFEAETQVFGDPRDARTGAYYIRPFDWPVIECFFGGEGAHLVERDGPAAGFAFALEQLGNLFGADVRRQLRPLVASGWGQSDRIGGAYSYAHPGHATARETLSRPFEQRVFFAGEATSTADFSTAHGAHDTGVRAASEVLLAK
jgi:monoamine oxidase